MPRPIVLDCDPGHDDAIAILLAAGSPEIDLRAITTVAGNQTLPKVTRNARVVCTAAGITDVPVAAGCESPLVRAQITAGQIHGESGLDGPTLPEPTVELDERHGVDVIIETVMGADPGEITLVPVGPLTNIAVAMRREPRIVGRVREVSLMGGSYTRGNTTPAAEFNILADPEAASAVFAADWPVTMVGLDLTHQAVADAAAQERIGSVGSPLSRLVLDLLAYFGSTYSDVEHMPAPPVHDPCAVARVIDPTIMTTVAADVAVETQGRLTYGMTVTDFDRASGEGREIQVATRLEVARFWELVVDALQRLG